MGNYSQSFRFSIFYWMNG